MCDDIIVNFLNPLFAMQLTLYIQGVKLVLNALQSIIGGRENESQCLLLRRTHLKRSTKKDQEKANHVDLLFAVCS